MALVHKNRYQVTIQGKGIRDEGGGKEEFDIVAPEQYCIFSDIEAEKLITRDIMQRLSGGVWRPKVTQKVAKFKIEKPVKIHKDADGWDTVDILLLSWAGFRGNIIGEVCELGWTDALGVNGGIGQMQVSNPEGETIYIDGILAKVSISGEVGKLLKMEVEGLGKIQDSLTWSSHSMYNTLGCLAVPGSVKVEGSIVGVKSWRIDIGGDVKVCEGVEQTDGVYLIYRPEIEITFEMDPVDSDVVRSWREREDPVTIDVQRKPLSGVAETEEKTFVKLMDMYVLDFGDELDNNIMRRKVKFACGKPTEKIFIYPTWS